MKFVFVVQGNKDKILKILKLLNDYKNLDKMRELAAVYGYPERVIIEEQDTYNLRAGLAVEHSIKHKAWYPYHEV